MKRLIFAVALIAAPGLGIPATAGAVPCGGGMTDMEYAFSYAFGEAPDSDYPLSSDICADNCAEQCNSLGSSSAWGDCVLSCTSGCPAEDPPEPPAPTPYDP